MNGVELPRGDGHNPVDDLEQAVAAMRATGVQTILFVGVAGNGIAYTLAYGGESEVAKARTVIDQLIAQERKGPIILRR